MSPAVTVVEGPQMVLNRIVDRLIDESTRADGFRWVYGLDACNLDWRRRTGFCPCGEEPNG